MKTLLLPIIVVLLGCSSTSEDTSAWLAGLKPGMSMTEVKATKPDEVTIHWDTPINPDSVNTEYDVTYADSDEAFRSAPGPSPEFFLVFNDEKYVTYGGRN